LRENNSSRPATDPRQYWPGAVMLQGWLYRGRGQAGPLPAHRQSQPAHPLCRP